MGHSTLLIHGRSFKPAKSALKKLWIEALRHGLERDLTPAKLDKFNAANIDMVYYGDHSNRFLRSLGKKYNEDDDIADRKDTLANLKRYAAHQFNKRSYKKVPGRSSFKELLADVGATLFGSIHLGDNLIEAAAPDIAHYWDEDTQFGSDVRFEMTDPLKRAMRRDDKILVISHSLGTMVSYDTFWKFSHAGEYRQDFANKQIDLWITLGSPLGDETVKRKLRGAGASGLRRYPHNVKRWVNFAAEDDFISHDEDVGNDFKEMNKLGTIIDDHDIYNLAIREGKSNPHNSSGYLVHPAVIKAVGDFL